MKKCVVTTMKHWYTSITFVTKK